MKTLRVITSMNPANGGPCQGIRNSVPQLQKLDMETHVLCLDDPEEAFIGQDVFPVIAVGKASGPWAYNKALMPWLLKHLTDYDTVIVHGFWQYHLYAVTRAMAKMRTQKTSRLPKVYLMPHGMLDPYFQKADGRRLKALRNRLYWKLIESKAVANADGLLFTCEEEKRLAATTFTPYHPKAVYNVSYGIQAPPAFKPEMSLEFFKKFPQLESGSYLLFLSRIHDKKGVDLLVEAFETVYGKDAGTCRLAIAGPGEDSEYGRKLKSEILKSPFLRERVDFLGMLQGDMKWAAFYNCQAFVLPSHQENFGIAVVEALACSKPVLISNKVNIYREIESAGGGLVNNDDLQGVIALLNTWKNLSNDDRKRLEESALKTYLTYYTIEQAALKLFELTNKTQHA